ncbi:MAG: saccharopine dehydrogenase family protein [Epsilonproteobacteria bacterium]|nr:saccharopine dehydrogenase [Campylobacterota bacterium]NPA56998.1 saccharopine dehydrogenase family protein [Campylobacterota bacterium]
MGKVLIIGAGGVGRVVAHKCALNPDTFQSITLASRTLAKCEEIRDEILDKWNRRIDVARVDADNLNELIDLINLVKPDIVINVALPYQDLTIMEACMETKVDYLDTANYEHPDTAKFEYKEQWALHEPFQQRGIMALLGSGFDPGVTNVFVAYAQKHLLDVIEYIDILDCNAGDHGYPFATNFNPEINIREVNSKGRYWENGRWIETEPMEISMVWNYPEIGPKKSYLLYHEEEESLVKHIKGLKRIRFWMTFSESYLTHLKVLDNVGLTRIDPVEVDGCRVVPLHLLKALLPDPASLGARTKGKTNIGVVCEGIKDGERRRIYIYNICDHQEAYKEVYSQCVSYTTGVPAMIGAKLMLEGKWHKPGVWNMEQFDPDPFMEELQRQGLPWHIEELDPNEKIG